MNRYLGTAICYILRGHKWRRLRKNECDKDGVLFTATETATEIKMMRRCSRCLTTKTVKARKAK